MLLAMAGQMDAVYVSTPHVFHGANALAVIEAGYDLLLEKPMVTTVEEALALVEAEKRTGRTVVIAFQGGLSPLVHDTKERARRGDFGDLVSRQCLDLGRLGQTTMPASGSRSPKFRAAASCSIPAPT